MAWNGGFAKLHEATIILSEMPDSAMKAFTAAHTAVLSRPCPLSAANARIIFSFSRRSARGGPEALPPPSCGAKWMMDSTDLRPWEPDALILLKGYDRCYYDFGTELTYLSPCVVFLIDDLSREIIFNFKWATKCVGLMQKCNLSKHAFPNLPLRFRYSSVVETR